METYFFSLESVGQMLAECYKRSNSNETGGILIGPNGHKNIITDMVASSAFAERQPETYYQSEEDIEYLNTELRRHQQGERDFKGYFHRHPGGMYYLSQGDLGTCRSILKNQDYKIDNHLLMCIITESNGNFPLFSYVVSLASDEAIVKPVKVKFMPKQCIKAIFGGKGYEIINSEHNCREAEVSGNSNTLRDQGQGDPDSELAARERTPARVRGIHKRR